MSKVKAAKLNRWATILSQKRYTIMHISGEENLWADLLTRWAVKPIPQTSHKSVKSYTIDRNDHSSDQSSFKIRALTLEAPIKPEAYDWPDSCLLYTSPSPRDGLLSRMPSSA